MDSNRKIASLLRDLASVQQSAQSKWGYKRAASAILGLDEPIEQYLLPNGTLRKIPNIGPSSTRVILEVLQTGRSAIVDAAVGGSPHAHDVERARGLREKLPEPGASGLPRSPTSGWAGAVWTTIAATCRCTRRGSDGVEPLEALVKRLRCARLRLLRNHRPLVRA
jgi:DNA polymerase/3'-5' exonuclease PolX